MPRIVTPDERRQRSLLRSTVLIEGIYNVGKTSLLYTLDGGDPRHTLAIDCEGGFKSVTTWGGDVIEIRSWQDAATLACYIGGPDPSITLQTQLFSAAHYAHAMSLYGPQGSEGFINLDKYRNIFFDSISELMAMKFKQGHMDNQVIDRNKQVTTDTRGLYGDVGSDILGLVRHMQFCPKNIIWLGRLEWHVDESKVGKWRMQGDGQKVGNHMPGIVDQVVTMARMRWVGSGWEPDDTSEQRVFVSRFANSWGFPAKERTQGAVEMFEEPNLGKLIDKLNQPARDFIARQS